MCVPQDFSFNLLLVSLFYPNSWLPFPSMMTLKPRSLHISFSTQLYKKNSQILPWLLLCISNQARCILSLPHLISTVIPLLQVSIWGGEKAQNNLNSLLTSLSSSIKPQFVLCSSQNDFPKVHTSDEVLDMFKRQKEQQRYQEARAKNARPEH